MAMFEAEGYCPSNAIWKKAMENGNKDILEELGTRRLWMVYDENAKHTSYAAEMLCSGDIGLMVAGTLQYLIPVCTYPESVDGPAPKGQKITLYDICGDDEIPACEIRLEKTGYIVGMNQDKDGVAMYIAKTA